MRTGREQPRMTDRYQLRKEPEAERNIIGALLLATINGDTDCAATVFATLTADDFTDSEYRTIFSAIARFCERGEPWDQGLLASALRAEIGNAVGLLCELIENVVTTAHVGHYAKLIADASRQRRVVCAVNDTLNK